MERTVADAALNLSVIAGPDPLNDYSGIWGPGVDDDYVVPPLPDADPRLPLRPRPRLRRRQADRLHEHDCRTRWRPKQSARRRRRDPGRTPDDRRRHHAAQRLRLRGKARRHPLLRTTRAGRADPLAPRGGRGQRRELARGPEVRQRTARRSRARSTSPRTRRLRSSTARTWSTARKSAAKASTGCSTTTLRAIRATTSSRCIGTPAEPDPARLPVADAADGL